MATVARSLLVGDEIAAAHPADPGTEMIQGGFKELLDEFLLEAQERVDEVETQLLELASGDAESRQISLARAKRELHTLKGNSG